MKAPGMNRSVALFLQGCIILLGLVILGLLLGEPHIEGRNAHATLTEIYFHDPFLAYVYVGAIPGFVALHRAFGIFGQVRRAGVFSPATVDDLQTIRRCALATLGFVAGGVAIIIAFGDGEDRPAGIFMGALVASAAGIVATAAARFARRLPRSLPQREAGSGY